MSANSRIEWTDHTFNPWIGCTKVSPACDHCYAERSTPARTLGVAWGAGAERRPTRPGNWSMPRRWNAQHEAFFAQHGRRQRVFCASLADVFDNEVPDYWRMALCDLIDATPSLDWLLLTKRIGNAPRMLPTRWLAEPRANVWLGATICNQEEADRDIPKLLQVTARVRFLSMEPLLGPVDITPWFDRCDHGSRPSPYGGGVMCVECGGTGHGCHRLHWVIAGGESGPGARPSHPDWFRGLRDQCQAAGVPFLFKQWGEWTPGENVERVRGVVDTAFSDGDDKWSIYPLNLATDHGHIDDQPDLYRVGKKAAGRLLDGREWNEVPK